MKRMVKSGILFLFCLSLIVSVSAAEAITATRVHALWKEVATTAKMEPLPLHIKEEKAPNAWVTAGESVTVTTGLMDLLQKDDEMFAVLAHEAGHAKLGHYQKRVGNATGVSLIAALLGKGLGDNVLADTAVKMGAGLATAGYSRTQEVQADDFAVDLAFKAGVSPVGLYTALARMAQLGGKTEPSGFNSHPPDDRRLKHIENRIRARDPKAVIEKPAQKNR